MSALTGLKIYLLLWRGWNTHLYITFKQEKHYVSLATQQLFSKQRFGQTPFLDRLRTKSVHSHFFHISMVRRKFHPLSSPNGLHSGIDSCESKPFSLQRILIIWTYYIVFTQLESHYSVISNLSGSLAFYLGKIIWKGVWVHF